MATVVMVMLLLTGCANASSVTVMGPTPFPAHATMVHVVRTSDHGPAGLPAFDYTARDATKVQELYDALLKLPSYVAQNSACPTDLGVQYQLTFSQASTPVLSAIADPSGCQVVVLAGQDNRSATHSNIWGLLAAAVGVDLSAVYPIPVH